MAYSRVIIPGDGATTQFNVTFAIGYINEDNITARVGNEVDGIGNPVYRTITFVSPGILSISGAPAGVGVPVVFRRDTEKDELLVDYEDGDIINDENLNTSQKQAIFIAQEALDEVATAVKMADGSTGISITAGATDTVPKFNSDGNLVEGPSVGDVEDAQENAASAAASAAAAAISAANAANSAWQPSLEPNGVDDTAAIQAILNTYGTFFAKSNRTYYIRSQIVMPASSGIVSLDPMNPATFLVDMSVFTNNTIAGDAGTTAVVFNASGLLSSPFTVKRRVTLQNIRILPIGYIAGNDASIVPARRTTVVNLRNCADITITGCEIAGFCVGYAIRMDSNSRKITIKNNYIHDWYSNDVWATNPESQTTGICMDQDRINGVGTTNFDISHNTITDLKKGAVPIAAYGPQSDAINVNGGNGGYGVISHNIIYNVDEGIDFFGQGINIVGNNIRLTSGAGIKSIHGAKRCNIANNIILDARGWGITVTSSVAGSVELNHFTGNFVEATGGTVNPFLTTTAALAIGETGGNVCTRNYFSGNTWYANGAMYLCKNNDILGGSTSENFSTSDEWRGPGTSGWFNSQNLLLICQSPIDPTVVKATLASNLTRNTSGEATVVWGAEVTDKRGEFNTGTGVWIAQLPGRYDVSVKMFTQALTAATNRLILSLKTNAGVDITQGIIQVPSTLPAQVKLVEFSVMVGSGLGLRTDLLLESTPGANVIFNATAAQTSFEIKTS